jgi:hypothetical protein
MGCNECGAPTSRAICKPCELANRAEEAAEAGTYDLEEDCDE